MFSIDLAIKFGGNEIVVYRKGVGVVAKRTSHIALFEGTNKIKAFGRAAEKILTQPVKGVEVFQPIINGEVVDEKRAVLYFKMLMGGVYKKNFLTKINALVAVPCALNEKQLITLKRVLNSAGIKKVTFVQNAVCAYEALDFDPADHVMIVDIGKCLTDISVLNEFNFDFGRMAYIGGADMDKSIITFIQDNYGLTITEAAGEEIKNEIASLYQRDLGKYSFLGVAENNKIVKAEITANEVRVAICNFYDKIFKLINEVLAQLPNEIHAQVYNNGVVFVGGGSSIPGLYEYASSKLDFPIIIPENPADVVVSGAGKLLFNEKDFIKIKF